MNKNKKVGKIKECKKFDKEIKLIRVFGIMMKDEHGEVFYTFYDKKKADEFYNVLISNK